uniref:Predicted protein n=1 Tax=Hordeum vulgare subsp. vulgare TaxID=112509 RepID=F2CT06_HORVV|nr:predicted protein [Hordeum vulgare subsp. vulgare]
MRPVPPPAAGILVVGRPGRQVRAEVRRAAVHRDARHGAPLKSPVDRPFIGRVTPTYYYNRPCFLTDSFRIILFVRCDSREEASCYTV